MPTESSPQSISISDDALMTLCRRHVSYMIEGAMIRFLGSGVNLVGHKDFVENKMLPNGPELARLLANDFFPRNGDLCSITPGSAVQCPIGPAQDLLKVAQVIENEDQTDLYNRPHSLFTQSYDLSPLHKFLAGMSSRLAKMGHTIPPQLIVTTNYDTMMEHGPIDAGVEFNVVSYANGENGKNDRGKFGQCRSRLEREHRGTRQRLCSSL